jgi:hypothetical protein
VIIEKNDKLLTYGSGYYGPSEEDFKVLLPGTPVPGWLY